jgi:hypothetical protein
MPLSAGTKLGPYEILTPIGAGGMGESRRTNWRRRMIDLDTGAASNPIQENARAGLPFVFYVARLRLAELKNASAGWRCGSFAGIGTDRLMAALQLIERITQLEFRIASRQQSGQVRPPRRVFVSLERTDLSGFNGYRQSDCL